MDSLEVATKSKKKAEDDLGIVVEKLSIFEAKLRQLESQFTQATQEKAKVEMQYKELLDRLSLAERLTNGLSSENERLTILLVTIAFFEFLFNPQLIFIYFLGGIQLLRSCVYKLIRYQEM